MKNIKDHLDSDHALMMDESFDDGPTRVVPFPGTVFTTKCLGETEQQAVEVERAGYYESLAKLAIAKLFPLASAESIERLIGGEIISGISSYIHNLMDGKVELSVFLTDMLVHHDRTTCRFLVQVSMLIEDYDASLTDVSNIDIKVGLSVFERAKGAEPGLYTLLPAERVSLYIATLKHTIHVV